MRFVTLWVVLIAMSVLTNSCRKQQATDWKIDISIKNIGNIMLDEAAVKWGDFQVTAGFVAPSGEKVHVSFDHPIPETATIRYSLPDGRKIFKTVEVKKLVPAAAQKDKDMTVMFEVNSNNDEIAVKFLHFIQKDGYAQLVPF
ncbi:MAG: hypothetical protein ACOYOU_01420 [Kiritimatiellia bacterium]